jgi:hypothetical protein
MTMRIRRGWLFSMALVCGLVLAACGGGGGGGSDNHDSGQPTVISGVGAITDEVDAYRTLLGGEDNGGVPIGFPAGRREINWDAVPDENADPNFLPADFFNATAAPRARGAVFTTPGDGVKVSADSTNESGTNVRFGEIDLSYEDQFQTFSPERLFSPIGSNIVDVTFFVPGTTNPAVVRGFGAVYTDVDGGGSNFEYFDRDGDSLGRFPVPANDRGLSFLGVAFDQPVVARVRITYGNTPLGPAETPLNGVDVAVMDDFIYGEPQPR